MKNNDNIFGLSIVGPLLFFTDDYSASNSRGLKAYKARHGPYSLQRS